MSITTKDIFDTIKSDVVIIKIDVEGHECKAMPRHVLDRTLGKVVITLLYRGRTIFPNVFTVTIPVCALHLHGVGQPPSEPAPHL